MNFAPFRAASLASAAASPRLFVKTTRNAPNCERKSLAICGHASPVLPPADDGLTITTDMLNLPNLCHLWLKLHGPILLPELSYLLHHKIRYLLV